MLKACLRQNRPAALSSLILLCFPNSGCFLADPNGSGQDREELSWSNKLDPLVPEPFGEFAADQRHSR